MDFFWMKTIWGVKKVKLFLCNHFFLDAISESKIGFRGFRVYRIQTQLFICLHHRQSQEMPYNAMARADSAAVGREGSRRRGLWRPWPGEEKHLHLAQLLQDGGEPTGEVQAALLPVLQQQCIYLMYLFQIQILCLRLQLLRKFIISQYRRALLRECSPPTTWHMSSVMCRMSFVTCNFFLFLFYWQSGEAYWWRVCYQRGLHRLVFFSFLL